MTLAIRVVHGVAWMVSGEIARLATQFVVTVILARLLEPLNFGLLAMATFATGLIETCASFGAAEALVQKPEAAPDDWSSVYWLGLFLGFAVGVIAVGLGPVAALFYRDQRVIPVLAVVAWTGVLKAIGATQSAWLAKHMRFRAIAQIEWIGVLVGGVVGLAMAFSGWGVWSLVANNLIAIGASSVLFHAVCPWRPRLFISVSSLRATLRFGLGIQGFAIVNYFHRRFDDALIGRYVGPTGLAYYSRAYQLMLFPVQSISGVVGRVMFPALAEIGGDLPRFRAGYLRAVSAIATVSFPAMLGLLVTAPEMITVIYGPRWAPAVPILQIFCLVGTFQSVLTTVGWIYLARGRTDLMLGWGTGASLVFCACFVTGVQWGVTGVAVGYAIANAVLLVPGLVIPYRLIHLTLADVVRSVRGPLIGAAIMACGAAVVRAILLVGEVGEGITLVGTVLSGVVTYLTWLWLTDPRAIRVTRLVLARARAVGGEAPDR